jgi:hypothetical protein
VAKEKVKIPRSLKGRLKEVADRHNFASPEALALHFVDRGLKGYETSGASASSPSAQGENDQSLEHRVTRVVEDQGYSSKEELIEHLLLRGLKAYEEPVDDPAALEARLRGLGYID